MGETDFRNLEQRGEEAVQQVKNALATVDLDGITGSINRALKSIARQMGIAKPDASPYIVRERGAEGRAAGKTVGGTVSILAALGLAGVGAVSAAVSLSLPFVLGSLACAGVLAGFGFSGVRRGRREKRLGELMALMSETLGERETVTLPELAQITASPMVELESLLREAIERGLIPEGHLRGSSGRKTLYLTDRSWEEALEADSRGDETEAAWEGAQEAEDEAEVGELPPEAREVVSSCAAFAEEMERIRSTMADEEVRGLVDGIVSKVGNIASYVCRYPQSATQLRKMTTYYLPTTAKLAASYAELEGKDGEQARSTRDEIRETLGLVDSALARFSDDLVQEQSWDLKSDMDVMRTMLEQDGLS